MNYTDFNAFGHSRVADSLSRRAAFRPSKQVACSIDVAVMDRSAMLATPLPYSKTCDTFGATDYTAVGTGLGREVFTDNIKRCSVPQGLVAKHLSERSQSHDNTSIRATLQPVFT